MMLRWKGLDSRRCRFDTFSNNNRVRRIENERRRGRKRSSRTAETCVYMCICMSEREREYMCGIDPFFHCLPIVCSRPWVNRPRRAYDGQNRLALACTRVTTDQEHVTLVAHAYRFRWIRQGRGVVAASVAEDLAAVSTMVLATSDVELTVAALAMGDQPIVRPGRRSLLLVVLVVLVVLLVLVLSVVSGLP